MVVYLLSNQGPRQEPVTAQHPRRREGERRVRFSIAAEIGLLPAMIVSFSSRRRHTRLQGDWSSDVCSSDLDCISEIPPSRWDWQSYFGNPATEVNKTNIKWAGVMAGVETFDPLFFGISKAEAELKIGRASCRERV